MWIVMERELEDDDAGKTYTHYRTFQYPSIDKAKEDLFLLVMDSLLPNLNGSTLAARKACFTFLGESFKAITFVEGLEYCSDSNYKTKISNLSYGDIAAKFYTLEEWALKMEIKSSPSEEDVEETPEISDEDQLYFFSGNQIKMSASNIREVLLGKRVGYILLGKRKFSLGRGYLEDMEARLKAKVIVTGVRCVPFEDLLYDDVRLEGFFSHDELAQKFSSLYGEQFKRTSMVTVVDFKIPVEKPVEVIDDLPF